MKSKGKIIQKASSILLCLLVLCSCGGTLMHNFGTSVGPSWERGEAVEFVFDATTGSYKRLELSVEAITTASCRLKQLAIRAEYIAAHSSMVGCDTFIIDVFDDEGRRNGATAGLLYQLRSNARPVSFPAKDSITIRLNHIMETATLEGITDVGVKITGCF